jgi:hypothetical protein
LRGKIHSKKSDTGKTVLPLAIQKDLELLQQNRSENATPLVVKKEHRNYSRLECSNWNADVARKYASPTNLYNTGLFLKI